MGVVDVERIADATKLRPQTRAVMFGTGFVVTSVPAGVLEGSPDAPGSITGYERVDATASGVVTTAAVQAAIAGQPITPAQVTTGGNVTVGGALSVAGEIDHGPSVEVTSPNPAPTTTGTGSAVILVVPIAANSQALLDLEIAAVAPAMPGSYTLASARGAGFATGGSPVPTGPAPVESLGTGIAPKIAVAYAAGLLTFTAHGPAAVVASGADNGGGKLRITLTSSILDTSLTGMSVTLAGLVGTPGGNGAHVATYVGGNAFDLLAVPYVAPDASGATVVHTTPPVLRWAAVARATVAT